MSAAKNRKKHIHQVLIGILALFIALLALSVSLTYADESTLFSEKDYEFIDEEEEEITYDVGITKIEDKFVYGKSKGQLGIQFAVVLESDADEPKAKSSLKMRCEAVPETGEKFDLGEYVKNFSIKASGAQTRRFFFPLDSRGAKFVKRMPSDAGTFNCTFNLPGYITIKKDLFRDNNPNNDTVQFEVHWKDKTLKVSRFER